MSEQAPDHELSEEDRRNAFRHELSAISEDGAGRIVGRIPKKALWGGVAALAILGLGGQAVEHYFGNLGLPSTSTSNTTPTFVTPSTVAPAASRVPSSPVAANAAVLHLKLLANVPAPAFTLHDQRGHPYGTVQARGRFTLVTFFDQNCTDICPVLGGELRRVLTDLGPSAPRINVIVVNTDPFAPPAPGVPAALSATGLGSYANVHFVTGPLTRLNAVWKAYGVQVRVGSSAAQTAHNSLVYFLSPTSQLLGFAAPAAHESATGVFTLSTAAQAQFAEALRFETVSLNQ